MEHSDFVVKCYNKQELAQMYFPRFDDSCFSQ